MIKQSTLLGYKHFFTDEHVGYNKYVEKINSKKLIQFVSIFNNQHLFYKQNNVEAQRAIWEKLLVSISNPERTKLSLLFNQYFPEKNNKSLLFNVITNLKIIEKELTEYRDFDDSENTDSDLIIAFLKAYLSINDELNNEQEDVFKLENNQMKSEQLLEAAFKFYLPAHLPYFEIRTKNDLEYQLHLAINFFQFVDGRAQLKEVLKDVLKKHGQSSWKEYIKTIYQELGNYHEIKEKDNILRYKETPEFIRSNSHFVNQNAKISQGRYGDFTFLRNKPVIQFKENEFIISYTQLLLDKIFQGFKFDFVRTMMNLPQYKKSSNAFGDCMSELSQTFSHPFFEKVIRYCFGDNRSMNLLFDKQINQLTDACIREGEVVYLFEFKDEIIPVKVKNSNKFEEIKAGIFEKFVFNKKNSRKKGVSQLSYAIENLAINLKDFDRLLDEKTKITYVPIIVYTDITLDFPGINRILDAEFKIKRKEIYKKLNSTKRGNIREIKDLVIINFRLFVDYQDYFKNGQICLDELFGYYNLKTKKQLTKPIGSLNDIFENFTSTNQILNSYISQKHKEISTPKRLKEERALLFEYDLEG